MNKFTQVLVVTMLLSQLTLAPMAYAGNSSLLVRGWPNYLAMGTVTNDAVDDLLAAHPVDAIFKYAGNDGAGDRGQIIKQDPATVETILEARYMETHKTGQTPTTVMPVLVVYTINASGGLWNAAADVTDDINLKDHYANLINICQVMESYKDAKHPHPATIILNPDFLGAMQQGGAWGSLTPQTSVNVLAALTKALSDAKLGVTPPAFDNNITGYIQSINWLIHTIAPDVPFGWQENTWAINSANWVHKNYSSDDLKANITIPITNYINSLGVFQGNYKPDFIVFDRFERDDFFIQKTQWFYNRRDWQNYLSFVNNISRALNVPAMLWQVPGGHMLTTDELKPSLTLDHVATAPDYFFGDASVAKNFPNNITSEVLHYTLDPSAYDSAPTIVSDYLMNDVDHNWDKPQLQNAIDHNIFAILWGGGSTTGVVPIATNGDDGGWLAKKVAAYYKNPIQLK